mmetsp:Transcript_22346/g.36757  ORF Transcript_22346/g.36757 Transcript_22346/m.36757 type:complete len:353 (-) Transcript_22346:37-1095(-)|eukprot:scaffold15170_cov128-Skeletonema_menzelii.AAC.1
MGALTTVVGGVTILLAGGGLFFRRRISRNWIQLNPNVTKNLQHNEAIIITGGNCGLGFEAAKDLAGRIGNGKIILACRNYDSGDRAASMIRQSSGNANVECMKLDLASSDSIRQFALDITKRNEDSDEQLDISALICNAGVWMPMEQKQKTDEGYEIHFGVNHLGHFSLIQSLLPIMAKSKLKDKRVVFVSSSLLKSGKIDMEKRDFIHDGRSDEAETNETKKRSFAPTGYCDSKLMNALTCRQLALELQNQQQSSNNITTYAVCPGFCKSNLGRSVPLPIYVRGIMRLFQRTSAQGAQNIVHVTVEDAEDLVSGALYQDGKIEDETTKVLDGVGMDVQKGLWDLSNELTKK